MLLIRTRISKIDTKLNHIKDGQTFCIALNNLEDHKDQLINIGFDDSLELGSKLLPGKVGNISDFNANGKFIKHTDEPKTTVYHQREWTWEDWGGYEHSKIIDVPYKRYPRDFIEPPSEELTIIERGGSKILISGELVKK